LLNFALTLHSGYVYGRCQYRTLGLAADLDMLLWTVLYISEALH